jgi:Family of unknown function (DUF5908)
MPIQIRELIITTSVEERKVVGETQAPNNGTHHTLPHTEREEMVQQCVDEVLKVLNQKKRR